MSKATRSRSTSSAASPQSDVVLVPANSAREFAALKKRMEELTMMMTTEPSGVAGSSRTTRSKKAPAKAAGSAKEKGRNVKTREGSGETDKELTAPALIPCTRCATKEISCIMPLTQRGVPGIVCMECRRLKRPCMDEAVKAEKVVVEARPVPRPKRSAESMEIPAMPPVKRQKSEDGGLDALIRALTSEISLFRRDVIAELAMSRSDARDRHASLIAAQNRSFMPLSDPLLSRRGSPLAGQPMPEVLVSAPSEPSDAAISAKSAGKRKEVSGEDEEDESEGVVAGSGQIMEE